MFKPELFAAVYLFDYGGAGDIRGHEIGSALNSAETKACGTGYGLDQESFAQARIALQKNVPSC
jgi:hypothetical protein